MFLKKLIFTNPTILLHRMRQLSQQCLPTICIFCSHPAKQTCNLCVDCQRDLPILPHHCPQCAQFLSSSNSTDLLCGTCLKKPPSFDRTYALFPYESPVTQLIIQLKFRHQLSHAKALGELFIQKIREDWYKNAPLPDVIVPVPLHPYRLRERGFNQVVEIAKPIARAFSIPLDSRHVARIKHTAAQSSLAGMARKQNVANAFIVQRNYAGLSIAVIDDVITTGHTIMEFCKVLKKHGAKQIHVWCAARRGL